MKSSTLHRSNLSKERIAVLEELLADKRKPYDSSPGVYIRSDKDRELDLLWQGFKTHHKDERSPGVYLSIGFVTGALCMFLMTAILNFGHNSDGAVDLNLWKKSNIITKTTPVNVAPASAQSSAIRTNKYVIKSGDTLESVSYKYYGTYSPSKVAKIQELNNISNPNRIKIGQEILLPAE
jgi:LysM repeat protein